MRIIVLLILKIFWEDSLEYIDVKELMLVWYRYVLNVDWGLLLDVKQDFRNVSIFKDGCVVFNIVGNKY